MSGKWRSFLLFVFGIILVCVVVFFLKCICRLKRRSRPFENGVYLMEPKGCKSINKIVNTKWYYCDPKWKSRNLFLYLSHAKWSRITDSQNNSCSICLSNFTTNDELLVLKCEHGYHEECLAPWLICKNTCPLCLRIVNVVNLKETPLQQPHEYPSSSQSYRHDINREFSLLPYFA